MLQGFWACKFVGLFGDFQGCLVGGFLGLIGSRLLTPPGLRRTARNGRHEKHAKEFAFSAEKSALVGEGAGVGGLRYFMSFLVFAGYGLGVGASEEVQPKLHWKCLIPDTGTPLQVLRTLSASLAWRPWRVLQGCDAPERDDDFFDSMPAEPLSRRLSHLITWLP